MVGVVLETRRERRQRNPLLLLLLLLDDLDLWSRLDLWRVSLFVCVFVVRLVGFFGLVTIMDDKTGERELGCFFFLLVPLLLRERFVGLFLEFGTSV